MSDAEKPKRSPAQQEASRRNGARSRGPKTAAGKARSARNALKHGLRARQVVLPEDMPDWIHDLERQLVKAVGHITTGRREFLDRLGLACLLLEEADRQIAAELARLAVDHGRGKSGEGLAAAPDLAPLRKLVAYRRRFRGERDNSLFRLAAYGRIMPPSA